MAAPASRSLRRNWHSRLQQTSKPAPGGPAAAAANEGDGDPRDQLVQDRLEYSGRVGRFLYGLFPAVAIPAYMVLWQGNIATMLAFWMQFTAEGYFVYLLTGSNSMLAIVGMARSLPMVVVVEAALRRDPLDGPLHLSHKELGGRPRSRVGAAGPHVDRTGMRP